MIKEILKLKKTGKKPSQIAKQLKTPLQNVNNLLIKECVRLKKKGLTTPEIASQVHVSAGYVSNKTKHLNLNSKDYLSNEMKNKIKELYDKSYGSLYISKKLKIDRSHVDRVLNIKVETKIKEKKQHKEATLNPRRNEGVQYTFMYAGRLTTIYNKDGLTKEQAVARWIQKREESNI